MEANQITGSKDNPLPASTGNAVGRMETPIKLFIQWCPASDCVVFCTRHLYFIIYILFPAGSLLSADVWLRGSREEGMWFTDTHWKANWPWHSDGSGAVPSAANLSSLPSGGWSGFASCSAVSCTPGKKATAFLPAAQRNWLALPCTSAPAVVRVVQREDDGWDGSQPRTSHPEETQ